MKVLFLFPCLPLASFFKLTLYLFLIFFSSFLDLYKEFKNMDLCILKTELALIPYSNQGRKFFNYILDNPKCI